MNKNFILNNFKVLYLAHLGLNSKNVVEEMC